MNVKNLIGIVSIMMILALTSVAASAGEGKVEAAPMGEGKVEAASKKEETAIDAEREDNMIAVIIEAGDRQFEASLTDNAATRELTAQLPMTLNMSELNGNEKYCYLPSELPTDRREIGTIHNGDLMLYGSDCLVLFYEDFDTSFQYTRLGAVSDPSGLAEALGSGSVQVTFRLDPS